MLHKTDMRKELKYSIKAYGLKRGPWWPTPGRL